MSWPTRRPSSRAEAALLLAQDQLQALEKRAATLQRRVESRGALADAYATAFKLDLDTRIVAATGRLDYIKRQMALQTAQNARIAKLAADGHASRAAADAEAQVVADMQRTLIELQGELDRSNLRRRAADQGTLLLDDGTDAAIAARRLDNARLDLTQTETAILSAKVDVDSARNILAAARALYEKMRRAEVLAPPGAMVWSLLTAPGSAVEPGSPVASWIDCSIMLVDVPASDVELALLRKGAAANVVLEGEERVRRGTVALTRGAAATIGQDRSGGGRQGPVPRDRAGAGQSRAHARGCRGLPHRPGRLCRFPPGRADRNHTRASPALEGSGI